MDVRLDKRHLALLASLTMTLPGVARAESQEDQLAAMDVGSLQLMSLEDLLNVKIVSGSLAAETRYETPVIVSVITSKDIETFQFDSLAEALQYVPGVDVLYDLSYYNVGVRGVNGGMNAQSQVLKTMVGGKDIGFRPTTGSFLGPELMPLSVIQHVEVVRGPASVLYGANAFLGVINIIPKTAADMGPGLVRGKASYVNNWGHSGGIGEVTVWGAPLGIDTVFAASGRRVDRSGLRLPARSPSLVAGELNPSSRLSQDDFEQTASAYTRAQKQFGEDTKISADANLQYLERNANFSTESTPLRGGRVSLVNGMARLTLEQSIADMVDVKVWGAYSMGQSTDRERLIDDRRAGVDYLHRSLGYDTLEGRLEVTLAPENAPYRLTVGSELIFESESLASLQGIRPPDEPLLIGVQDQNKDIHNVAGFLLGTWNVTDDISLVGGLRLEDPSNFSSQFSYRGGLVYMFTEDFSAKALVGRSFKAPSPSLMYSVPVLVGGPESNENLDAQHALTFEAYVGGKVSSWLEVSLNGYYTRISDFAEIDIQSIVPRAENTGTIDAVGGELDVKAWLTTAGLEGFFNAAYVTTNKTSDVLSLGGDITGLYPQFMASAGVAQTFESYYVRFYALAQGVTSRPADYTNIAKNSGNAYSLPGYVNMAIGASSVGLTWADGSETRFGVKVNNLLNNRYVQPGFLGIDVPGERIRLMATVEQTL